MSYTVVIEFLGDRDIRLGKGCLSCGNLNLPR